MTRKVFILIPSDTPHGPVKGAYALANVLAETHTVYLVALRRGQGAQARLVPQVRHLCLAHAAGGFVGQVRAYQTLLKQAGGRDRVASLSMCLSADVVNSLCRRWALTCSSVRGNLSVNYRHDYGWPGAALAMAHLTLLRRFDHVVTMTNDMASQVRRFIGHRPQVVGNFVDEQPLDAQRVQARASGPLRLVFVGSLSDRKQPGLLLPALAALRAISQDARLDIVGAGPLDADLRAQAQHLGLNTAVRMHGFLDDPARLVAQADVFVLPSLAEGMSRAALEALHLGLPCVMRDADGNSELITPGINGVLFASDADLSAALASAATLASSQIWPRASLLPQALRQHMAGAGYADILQLQ